MANFVGEGADLNQVSTAEVARAAIAASHPQPGASTPAAPQTPTGTPAPTAGSSDPQQAREVANVEEPEVWSGRYSRLNFVGRFVCGILLTIAAGVGAYLTQGFGGTWNWVIGAGLGGVVAIYWLALLVRFVRARYGHHYTLTTRRLFISTGVTTRRRDQIELLRVKDVYIRQTWMERMLGLGTVIVVSSEESMPTSYLTGVSDPKTVMDVVWRYARAEQDRRSVRVDSV